jgi:hypothetical protein
MLQEERNVTPYFYQCMLADLANFVVLFQHLFQSWNRPWKTVAYTQIQKNIF